MYELHENEQYFFDEATLDHLSGFLLGFSAPCCVCQLFAALRMLSRNDFSQPLLVSYLKRRSEAVLGTFAPFGLRPTGYLPSYQTVEAGERNEIEFFSNLPEEDVRRLAERRE